jgi:hypothetical protein
VSTTLQAIFCFHFFFRADSSMTPASIKVRRMLPSQAGAYGQWQRDVIPVRGNQASLTAGFFRALNDAPICVQVVGVVRLVLAQKKEH